jgi:hypothetical protein
MGYLNNTSITVDAILTKKGRELLARGRNEFRITQFALADDEIDYSLWNPDHPLGSAYYGVVIENLPMIEALADESQMIKYKLITLPKTVTRIPVIQVSPSTLNLTGASTSTIVPNTINFANGNSTYGYTAILSDSSVADIRVSKAAPIAAGATVPQFIGDSEAAQTVTVSGLEFIITAKPQYAAAKTATIVIIGNETGGRQTITLTVPKATVATTGALPRGI